MNEIGGYFELELAKGEEFHKEAIRLNTGRNAFEYILRAKNYRKVYLPYYTCDVMLEPIKKLHINYEFYHLNNHLEPIFDFDRIGNEETFVYNNYFGMKGDYIKVISNMSSNLIIDNSQAFFEKPINGIDTFYSPRKFFGVPDGAYLYTDKLLNLKLDQDSSYLRAEHLMGRLELGAGRFYNKFLENDNMLVNLPIRIMSKLTMRMLQSVNYNIVSKIRRDNFQFIHEILKYNNKINIDMRLGDDTIPLVYPFMNKNGIQIKKVLIERKIYVATYWPNVMEWCEHKDVEEKKLIQDLVPIPIDQRYTKREMTKIALVIKEYV